MMRAVLSFFHDLGRNLLSGGLMVFGQRATRLSFRVNVPQLIALFVVSALLDIALDFVRQGGGAVFTSYGLVGEAFYGAILMVFAALLALAFRQPAYALALPVVLLAGEWPLMVVRMGVELAFGEDRSLFGSAVRAEQALLLWTFFWLWRSAATALAPRRPYFWLRSLFAGALLATPLWFGSILLPDAQWWETPEAALARSADYPSPVAEEVLVKQPELLYDALASLDEGRDEAALRDLRRRCAGVLRSALPDPASRVEVDLLVEALLASLRFSAFPDVRPALESLRESGRRLVVVSNWDVSLVGVLRNLGLEPLLDAIVTSAGAGARKPSAAIFEQALDQAGVPAGDAIHVGDSLDEDVAGARTAGIEPILIHRGDGPPVAGVRTISSLSELAASVAA